MVTVPAEPGWAVVEPVWAPGRAVENLHEEPVLAWRISLVHGVTRVEPICAQSTAPAGARCYRRPNGTYFAPNDREFDSAAEVESWFENRGVRR